MTFYFYFSVMLLVLRWSISLPFYTTEAYWASFSSPSLSLSHPPSLFFFDLDAPNSLALGNSQYKTKTIYNLKKHKMVTRWWIQPTTETCQRHRKGFNQAQSLGKGAGTFSPHSQPPEHYLVYFRIGKHYLRRTSLGLGVSSGIMAHAWPTGRRGI